jgi:atypical dual specificity phosphatase
MIAINPILINNFITDIVEIDKKNIFEASEILSNLYIGSFEDAKCEDILINKNIKYILNISNECNKPNYQNNFIYKQIFINDHSDAPLNLFFEETNIFIHDALKSSKGILVHCKMGISRSSTIVIAYIMNYGYNPYIPCKVSFKEAFRFVKKKRNLITPNFGFCLYLRELDILNGFKKDILGDTDDDSNSSTPCSF